MSKRIVQAIDRLDYDWLSANRYTKRGGVRPVFSHIVCTVQPMGEMRPVEYAFYMSMRAVLSDEEVEFDILTLLMGVTPADPRFLGLSTGACDLMLTLLQYNPHKAARMLTLWMDDHRSPHTLFKNADDYHRILHRVVKQDKHEACVQLFARLLWDPLSSREIVIENCRWHGLIGAAIQGRHTRALVDLLLPRYPKMDLYAQLWLIERPDVARALVPWVHVPHLVYWIRKYRTFGGLYRLEWEELMCDLTMRERCIHALLAKRGIPPELAKAMGAGGPVPPLSTKK
jgi:hypothetical protein